MHFLSSRAFWDNASVVLEMIAFVLVTLDLWGKRRLRNWTKSILEALSFLSVMAHETEKTQDEIFLWLFQSSAWTASVWIISFLVAVGAAVWTFDTNPNISMNEASLLGLAALVACLISFWEVERNKVIELRWSAKAVSWTYSKLLQVFAFERTEGTMVVIGSILFFVSKAMELWLMNVWPVEPKV